MSNILIFGMGYTSSHLAEFLRERGWKVTGTRRSADGENIAFDNEAAVHAALAKATHILSSVPPDKESGDAVLNKYGDAIGAAGADWIGYLSSTGVYGDAGGAWVDESAAVQGRRPQRNAADLAWQELRADVRVFRLPGIYGPERSALERVEQDKAHRIDLPEQVFSRIHVDDIVGGIAASFDGPPGVYNLSDDMPCAQNDVISYAAMLLGRDAPPMQSLEQADLSPMALSFYAENRRVANGKAKRLLGWQLKYADYAAGLRACMATTRPIKPNAAPPTDKDVQT